ncbi:hypothetical protein [Streptomyces sp. NPDC096351]|uniref:hypothetical protein n=1 Tax=Streptomyces sp. NPDC096351 TaxID=3366087 RepID=UPI0037FF935D
MSVVRLFFMCSLLSSEVVIMSTRLSARARRASSGAVGKALLVSSLALVPLAATATPANAAVIASPCSTGQNFSPEAAGINPSLYAQVCVEKDSSGKFRGKAYLSWGAAGQNDFWNIDLQLRLEKNDVVKATATCDFTSRMNSTVNSSGYCYTSWMSLPAGGVTGDATLVYDSRDVSGETPWQLHGSPTL